MSEYLGALIEKLEAIHREHGSDVVVKVEVVQCGESVLDVDDAVYRPNGVDDDPEPCVLLSVFVP